MSPLADASDADAHIRDKAHGHKEPAPPLGHAPTKGEGWVLLRTKTFELSMSLLG